MRAKLTVRVIRPCYIGGRSFAAGELVGLDPRTANDVINESCGELLDPADGRRLRDAVREIYAAEHENNTRSRTSRVGAIAGAADGPWRPLR